MDALLPATDTSSTRWSFTAGLYMYACGTIIALALDPILRLFGEVIGLDPSFSMLVMAVPALVLGSMVWWRLVERPAEPSYLRAGAFGLLTAFLTGLVWVVGFVMVWGLEMLAAGPVLLLVGVVLATVCTGGMVAGLPFMYVRRRAS